MGMKSTSKPKGHAGRPPKLAEDRRTKIIRVLATEAEYELISGAAKAAGRDLSAWLREVGLEAAER